MAVDTRNKRAAVIGLALVTQLTLPAPDGTIDANDRAHVSFCYFGLDVVETIVTDVALTGSYVPSYSLTGSNVVIETMAASYVPSELLTGSTKTSVDLTGSNVPSFPLTVIVEDV